MRGAGWTVVSIAALALSSGLILGWGAISDATPAEAQGASSTSVVDDRSSTDATEASQSAPAVAEMSVFSRPRTETDILPPELAYRLEGNHVSQGDAEANESRLLLSGMGVREKNLYAWPTENGWVCFAWAEGAGACLPDFDSGAARAVLLIADQDGEGIGAPGAIVGVVPDDVVGADVTVEGVRHPAILDRNGVFYELPDGGCTMAAFQSLTAAYRDGTSETVRIESHHGPKPLRICGE
jgi:hypothetical protein